MEQRFFQEIFLDRLNNPLSDLLHLKTDAIASFQMERGPVQDPFRYRAKQVALRVAYLVIDDQGELGRERLKELLDLIDQTPFIVGPQREDDRLIFDHLRGCLRWLQEEKEVWALIRKCSPPLCHKKAEEMVRQTLWPASMRTVQTVHVRRAVVAAWLTVLRQTTGSCFATAPAIFIQRKDPLRFFKDLYDLLSMGQLKRTVAGKEYAVPLTFSTGNGDLQRVSLGLEQCVSIQWALEAVGVPFTKEVEGEIKALGAQSVEFTLKAVLLQKMDLSETDLEEEEQLSRIQMGTFLARQTGVYYQKPTERAQKVAEWKKKWEKARTTFQTMTECALLRGWEYTLASFCDVKTDFARWNLYIGLGMHPEHKGGVGAFFHREFDHELQKCGSQIMQLTQEYEQEMGTMQAIETMLKTTSSEMRISQLKAEWMTHNLAANRAFELKNETLAKAESLGKFFSSCLEQYDRKLQESFQELFDPSILEENASLFDDSFAGFRLVYKHGRLDASQWTPIYNAEQYVESLREFFSQVENEIDIPEEVGKKFISEITTGLIQWIRTADFLQAALKRSQEIGRKSPWDYISGGTLETLLMSYCNRDRSFTEKSVVPHSAEELLRFLRQFTGKEPLLMHSPTHAFIFYPALLQKEMQKRKSQKWDELMQEHLAHRLSERLPEEERALFIHLYRQKNRAQSNGEFRLQLIDALGSRMKQKGVLVDSVLYENSWLYTQSEAEEAVQIVLRALGKEGSVDLNGSFWGPVDLYQTIKMAILKHQKTALSSVDWDLKISEAMHLLGLGSPLLFADTNWSGWFFGFVINPATSDLELWRLNRNGLQGFPMTDWKEWLSQKNTTPWVVLSEPKEYE